MTLAITATLLALTGMALAWYGAYTFNRWLIAGGFVLIVLAFGVAHAPG